MVLVYCELCGLRIPQDDIAAKSAIEVEQNRWHCPKCIAAQADTHAKPISGGTKIHGADPVSGTARPMSDSKRRLTPPGSASNYDTDSKRKNTPGSGVVTAATASAKPSSGETKAPSNKPPKFLAIAAGATVLVVVAAMAIALSMMSSQQQSNAAEAKKKAAQEALPPAAPDSATTTPSSTATTPEASTTKPPETLTAAEMEALAASAPNNAPPPSEAQTFSAEMDKMRSDRAQKLLDEADAYAAQKPADVKGLRKRYSDILRSYRSTPAGDEVAKRVSEMPQENPAPPLDEAVFANGIHMLPLLDLNADKVSGEWSCEGNDIKMTTGKFHIPYDPGGDYDIRFVFTRLKEGGPFGLYLRKDLGKQFLLALSLASGDRIGCSKVDGKTALENPTTTRVAPMKTGQKYTVVAQIRSNVLRVYYDGVCKIQYETDFKEMSLDSSRALKSTGVLGLFSDNVPVLVHSVDIAEVGSKGTFTRQMTQTAQSGQPIQPGTSTEPAAAAQANAVTPPEAAKASPVADKSDKKGGIDVPLASLKTPASNYETLAVAAYALAANGGVDAAKSKVEAAKKDTAFSAQASALENDAKLLAALAELDAAVEKGVAALADRRAFKFDRTDGKSTAVGKGSRTQVKGVKNGKIILEERVGGASAESQLDLQVLTPGSRLDLARLGVANDPEGQTNFAAGLFVAQYATESTITEAMVDTQIEAAAKAKGTAALLDHLRAKMKSRETERELEKSLAQAKELVAAKKNEEALEAIKAFVASASGTALGERSIPEVTALVDELKARNIQNGLWVSVYSSDSKTKFKKLISSGVQKKPYANWGANGPVPDGPTDHFAVAGRGMLRIETAGTYEFSLSCDDGIELYVAGKKIAGGNGKSGSATLEKGDHSFSFRYHENTGNASYNVRWKAPGAKAFGDIPESALVYDPAKIAEYEKN